MSELVDSHAMLEAFSEAIPEYWSTERELLALILETLHTLLRVTLKANGSKRVPSALEYPRPDSTKGKKAEPVSMSEYADYLKSLGKG